MGGAARFGGPWHAGAVPEERQPADRDDGRVDGWDDVGALLHRVLGQLAAAREPAAGDGLCLVHVPSSTLGQERGLDLRWEVASLLGGVVEAYENAGSPAAVLALFTDRPAGPAPQGWEEVGPLLREVAGASHRLLGEDAVIDLSCRWEVPARSPGRAWRRPRSPRWTWRFEAAVGDALDDPQLTFAWEGRSPVEVLRAARDATGSWAPR